MEDKKPAKHLQNTSN
jgi:cytochrome P450